MHTVTVHTGTHNCTMQSNYGIRKTFSFSEGKKLKVTKIPSYSGTYHYKGKVHKQHFIKY